MATITASAAAAANQPKYHDVATITRVWNYTRTTTLTADIVVNYEAWKIPDGATITSVKLGGQLPVNGASVGIFNVVLRRYDSASAATNVILGSATISAAIRLPVDVANTAANLPYTLDIDDDSVHRYAHIYLQQTAAPASPTVSESVVFIVQYVMDP